MSPLRFSSIPQGFTGSLGNFQDKEGVLPTLEVTGANHSHPQGWVKPLGMPRCPDAGEHP